MSEIFDFLKKTETEHRKKLPIQEEVLSVPLAEFQNPHTPEVAADTLINEPPQTEIEVCEADRFDLKSASLQIKSALDPLTLFGEQFRLLRSRLGLMQKQRGIKTILITSTGPKEGKTFTASGMVGVFAQEPGKRVVLIDADMRKPASGQNFGINGCKPGTGLSEVLRGNIEFSKALILSMNPEFYFLPSGPLPSNPSELLSSPKLDRLLKTAAENFDWVIVDSPPVLSLSDSTLISPLCDAVILVVRADSTPSKLVLDSINQIGRDRICGVILNRLRRSGSSHYYYQYYYTNSKRNKE
jgi:capsular exopolysaccharide synthesis family protein